MSNKQLSYSETFRRTEKSITQKKRKKFSDVYMKIFKRQQSKSKTHEKLNTQQTKKSS